MGSTKREENSNLYYIFIQTDLLILVLCVDGLFFIVVEKLIERFKADMVD
jgi:hypothetical protein